MAKVLVVDDDRMVVQLLVTILTSVGHQVTTANNGAVALEIITKIECPDLVILDLKMPVMNGDQLMAAIYNHPEGPKPPMILLSGYITDAKNSHYAARTIDKPFNRDSLLRNVQEVLEGKLPTDQ